MTPRPILLLLLLAALLISSASAVTFEESYDTEFNKLKDTRDYLYRSGDTIQWHIVDYNPDFEYIIKVLVGDGSTTVLDEYLLKIDPSKSGQTITGEITLNTEKYPGKITIYLQNRFPLDKPEMGDTLCNKYRYISSYGDSVCDSSKNLDILTISQSSKIEPKDSFIEMIRFWTRALTDTIRGASWDALKTVAP